jgi:uncharacterized protein YodC (DUF2158 family)
LKNKFQVGDVVSLNSGGPSMVVTGYGSQGGFTNLDETQVQWLNDYQQVQTLTLPSACFQKYVEARA